MNRLTVRVSDGIEFKPKVYKWDIKKRLAEYEDTGLKPDEIPQLQEKYDTAIKALSGAILEKAEIPQWIPVSERLPEKEQYREKSTGELIPLFVCVKGTKYPFRAYYDGRIWGDGFDPIDVIYWMPLPTVPKGEK